MEPEECLACLGQMILSFSECLIRAKPKTVRVPTKSSDKAANPTHKGQ